MPMSPMDPRQTKIDTMPPGPPPLPPRPASADRRRDSGGFGPAVVAVVVAALCGCSLWAFGLLVTIWSPKIDVRRFIARPIPADPRAAEIVPKPEIARPEVVAQDPAKEAFLGLVRKN